MEVKPEYKQTEVGIIPEDWKVKHLSHVAVIRGGIAKNSNVAITNPISVHYLRVANVQDGFLDLSEVSRIQLSRHDLKRYTLLPGDVLMNEGGDLDKLGRGAIWRGELNQCVHQNHVFVVRCKAALIPDYLNVWTETCPARRFFLLAGKQTTNLASISKSSLGELPIAVPLLPEQCAIASALSDVDALLGGLERLIAKKRDLKQAAMQQLLTGQTRLPGEWEVKPGYKHTEVGVLPEDWEVSTIGHQSRIFGRIGFRGYTVDDIVEEGSGAIAISPSNVQDGKTVFDKCTFISWRKYEESPEIKIDDGDIILVKTGSTFGKTAMVKNLPGKATLNPQVVVFKNVKPSPGFFGYMMGFPIIQNQIGAAVVGGALPTLSQKLIASFKLPLPPLPEQTAITAVLSDMDAELSALEARRDKIRALKQGMMQELLTGRTRLI